MQSSTKPKQKNVQKYNYKFTSCNICFPPQNYCSSFVLDGTFAWAELVLWTYGRQSGHNSVSVSFCWIELTSSKFEIIICWLGKTVWMNSKAFPKHDSSIYMDLRCCTKFTLVYVCVHAVGFITLQAIF